MLIFCADSKESGERYKERGKTLHSVQDATIACAYAQLTATSLGLSGCWMGSFEEKEIKKVVKTDLTPVAILTLGYSAENPERRKRKTIKQISEIIN